MNGESSRLEAALGAIDDANAADPNEIWIAGKVGPKELLHGRRATEWVLLVDPRASDAQLIAARAHHLRRWTRPRGDYPDGRAGYLRWRADAKRAHADEVAGVLRSVGYDDATADEVGAIIRKERLAQDTRVQTHEDALCLTFLESQLDELSDQLGDEHMATVLAKTMAKMSPGALALAGALPLSEQGKRVLGRAADLAAGRGAAPSSSSNGADDEI